MTETERVERAFRVMAELKSGGDGLVCVAESRAEAVAKAWLFARHRRLPAGTVRLRLEWWDGRWVRPRTWPDELPAVRVPKPRVVSR